MKPTDELSRLRQGPAQDERPTGGTLIFFRAHANGNARDVLTRAKEVLGLVLSYKQDWPADDAWRTLLPGWFVRASAPETTAEDEEKWLSWWRTLTPQQQARAEQDQPWSIQDWLHWFNPDERRWYWWDAEVVDDSVIRVTVDVEEWPFPSGALAWLFRASGAVDMFEEPLDQGLPRK